MPFDRISKLEHTVLHVHSVCEDEWATDLVHLSHVLVVPDNEWEPVCFSERAQMDEDIFVLLKKWREFLLLWNEEARSFAGDIREPSLVAVIEFSRVKSVFRIGHDSFRFVHVS